MADELKNIKLVPTNEAYLKVTYFFFSYPNERIGLNDLSEALKISKTTSKRVILQLVKGGFLKKEEIGRVWRISCNLEHAYNSSRKISFNLSMILESNLIKEIHKIVNNPKTISLFGSYRKGDDTENSDIDIAVEVLGNEELKMHQLGIIPKFGYRKNVKVNLHIFSRNKIDLNLFANMANGIILEGFLEVKP